MTRNLPRTPPRAASGFPWEMVALAVALVGVLYGVREIAGYIQTGKWTPGWPHTVAIQTAGDLARGKLQWTPVHTWVAVVLVLIMMLAAFIVVTIRSGKPRKTRLETAATHLGNAESMTLKAVSERSDASRLTTGEVKGMMIVETMRGAQRWVDHRSTGVIIAGPGSGKTTGEAIPLIMNAPGVVFATANKRDLRDAIIGAKDGRVWVFDPQQICGKNPAPWRLNLLDYVTDEVRAHKLAKIWVDANSEDGAKKDAYFDTAGPNLLAGLLLAVAKANRPISQVYKWLTNPANQEAVQILEDHGYELPAMALQGVYDAPDEQRGGVFGTASETVSFLNNSRVRQWLEPQGTDDMRPIFSPEDFVRSGNETMLALSKEGIGTTGPLTASLTMWVLDAAEDMADEYAHGRLPIPLAVILDEAANVCRIKELPSLYSHYGSRGIFPVVILQTWAQGKRVWGEDGMLALWGAATFCIMGAGQKDTKFLETISKSLGQRYIKETSTSSGGRAGSGRSVSTSHRLHDILTVDDLIAMRLFEAVVIVSGEDPFVGRFVPWMNRPEIRDLVQASIDKYEPQGVAA